MSSGPSSESAELLAARCEVMVVEDNLAVAAIHKRVVDSVSYFRTAHIARNGEEAYAALRNVQPDLVILDLTMPGGDGLPFLRRVRTERVPVDFILVTASDGGRVVQEALQLGALDYLVKPFDPERLREALSAYAVRHRTLIATPHLSQSDVDTIHATGAAPFGRRLPKGLKKATLSRVLDALRLDDEPRSAEEMGHEIGVARVTARRYLEYLDRVGTVQATQQTAGPGRPRKHYALRLGVTRQPPTPTE